jgi:hypothetical protein
MKTGSGCKQMPNVSSTRRWIPSFKDTISAALAPPRFTMANACLLEIPTFPRLNPLANPAFSTNHAAEIFN